MPTSWADSSTAIDFAAAPGASVGNGSGRSTYVPPHLRNRPPSAGQQGPPSYSGPALGNERFVQGVQSGGGARIIAPRNDYNRSGYSSGGGWNNRIGGWERGREREANPFGPDVDAEQVFNEQENTGINFDAYEDIPVETSGENVPLPVNTFAEIDLGEALNQNIRRCKYVKPTPVQRHAIPISLAGRDLMACAQTGSGKTAAFCFPIISGIMSGQCVQRPPRMSRMAYPLALILSPTRELSCQIHEEARKFAYQTGVRVLGGSQTIVKMSNYDALRMASDFLANYIFLAVGRVGSSTDLIAQRVEFVQETDKRSHLMDLLHAQRANGGQAKCSFLFISHNEHLILMCLMLQQSLTLVFVETKKGADSLEHWLCMNGFPATAIHGDRSQQEREYALRSFKTGHTPILVATDVAARGLDIPHVAHVINFDLPNDIDDYVHRIGRTGRAGKTGLATAFFNENNASMAKALSELMQEANQEVPDWLSRFAARSYGGKNRRGGGRFGSRDFRRDSSFNRGPADYYGGGNAGVGYGGSGGYNGAYAAGATSAWD
ncbi:hypothetical protein Leryth_003895 [Lithospermum erythrorhizon]|nr:hypothetical protein Leryth_003895 [Lithospermum erythrorhizon]